jgi:hypothetical protein
MRAPQGAEDKDRSYRPGIQKRTCGWLKVRPAVKLQIARYAVGARKTGGIGEARNDTRSEIANQHKQMGHADICPERLYVPGSMP